MKYETMSLEQLLAERKYIIQQIAIYNGQLSELQKIVSTYYEAITETRIETIS